MTDGLKDRYRTAIIDILAANERVEQAVLFGSRAMDTYTPGSDVDIVLFGRDLTQRDLARLNAAMEELTVPQRVDLLIFDRIRSKTLIEHIENRGIEFYRRSKVIECDYSLSNLQSKSS